MTLAKEVLTASIDLIVFERLKGTKIKEIASVLAVGETTLKNYLKTPDFERAFESARMEYRKGSLNKIEGLVGAAINTIKELLDSEEDGVRLRAAKEILDRAGLGTIEPVQNNITINQINTDRTEKLAIALGLSHKE